MAEDARVSYLTGTQKDTAPYKPHHWKLYVRQQETKKPKDPWCDIFLKRKSYKDRNNVPSEKQEPRKPRKPRNLENKENQEKQKQKTKKIKRPMMWYIFEKEIVQGPQKQCSQVKNKNLENLENLET